MADGFLGRWAKRKEAVRKGEQVAPEPPLPPALPARPAPGAAGRKTEPAPALGEGHAGLPAAPAAGGGGALQPAAPTLEDVQALTRDSDFTRFIRPDVSPEVKNAAMKKLFSDPHFNVMDRMDTYIDDYSQPDPIPPAMLRQLASAKFLKLFADEDEEADKTPTAREQADAPAAESVAQSGTAATNEAVPPAEDHADPDLRLQQDHAPGRKVPGPGAE